MKKKCFLIFITTLILLSVLTTGSFAMEAELDSYVVNDQQWISVSGSTLKEFENVSIVIVKPGKTISAGMSEEELNDSIFAMTTVDSDENNQFFSRPFRFSDTDPSGIYTIYIKTASGESETITYNLLLLRDIMENYDIICTSEDETVIMNTLSVYGTALGLDLTEYGSLNDAGKVKALELFVANRKATRKTTFVVAEIGELIKEASMIEIIKEANEAMIAQKVALYEPTLKLKETEIYVKFSDKISDVNLCKRILMRKDDYSTYSTLRETSDLQVLLQLIGKNSDWYTVKDIISNYDQELGINLAYLKEVKNEDKVYQELNGKQCYTKADIVLAYRKAIDAVKISEAKVTGSKGTGSGSSGGGTKIGLPIVTPIEVPVVVNEGSDVFEDVKQQTPWAVEAVKALTDKNIVMGRSKDSFEPNDFVTREEFAKLVVSMIGQQPQNTSESTFDDVEQNSWYLPYVVAAQKNNLVKGITETKYGVGEKISRQDMSVMIYRAMCILGVNQEEYQSSFDDQTSIADYALQAVGYLEKNDIVKGRNENEFAPLENATRAEAAQMIYNALKFLDKV